MMKQAAPRPPETNDVSSMWDTLSLRKAGPDDLGFLFELYASTRRDELAGWPWNAEQKHAFLKMQFDLRERQYKAAHPAADDAIVLDNDRPIGRAVVDRSGPDFLLVDIAMMPERQGAGIGGHLIRSFLAQAAEQKKGMRLQVLATNPAARLYERLGFAAEGQDGLYLRMYWQPPAIAI